MRTPSLIPMLTSILLSAGACADMTDATGGAPSERSAIADGVAQNPGDTDNPGHLVDHPTDTDHPGVTDHPTDTDHPGVTDHPTDSDHPGVTDHPTDSDHPEDVEDSDEEADEDSDD